MFVKNIFLCVLQYVHYRPIVGIEIEFVNIQPTMLRPTYNF